MFELIILCKNEEYYQLHTFIVKYQYMSQTEKLVSYSMQDFIGTLKIIVYLSQKIYNKQLKVQSSNQVLNSVDLVGFLIDSHLATFTFLGHERML